MTADAEPAGSAPPRFFAGLISASSHTCVILDATFADWQTLCWGNGAQGQLGYGNTDAIGDDETPAASGAVDLGLDRTALAIAAGAEHTCALLDNGKVRCWGNNDRGQIGTGNPNSIGDDETPRSAAPVDLGTVITPRAVAAGYRHTCVTFVDGSVKCWGQGTGGHLGYGNTTTIGDNETPAAVGPVNIGGTMFVIGEPTTTLGVQPHEVTQRPDLRHEGHPGVE